MGELAFATSADGTKIAYETAGAGPVLVIVGGALSSRTHGANLQKALGDAFSVVALDRRGRGDSGDTPPYAVEREIEDLAAVIEPIGGSALVYGHSSGGSLALRAVAAGVPILRLAIYESILADPSSDRGSGLAASMERLLDEGRDADAVESFLRDATGTPPEIVAATMAGPAWPAMVALAPTLPYDFAMAGVGGAVPPPVFEKITIPVLALDGGRSPDFIRQSVAAITGQIASARHATIPDQRHNPATEALAPVLRGFFTTRNV